MAALRILLALAVLPAAAASEEEDAGSLLQSGARTKRSAAAVSVEDFRGAQIVSASAGRAAGGRWSITIKGGCSDSEVHSLTKGMPAGTKPLYEGHPDEGGLCLFVMTGTKEQIKEELASHKLPMERVIAEEDEMVEVPEVFEDLGAVLPQGKVASWGLDRLDDRQGLDGTYRPMGKAGEGVHVFVVDSGIRCSHAEFGGRAVPALDLSGGSVQICGSGGLPEGPDLCADDSHGHGTHCAGTVGGKTVGVAPKAQLFAVKVLKNDGKGYKTWTNEALDQVLIRTNGDTAGKIVSMSLSGAISPTQDEEVARVVERGLTVVVAAGNDGLKALPDACDHSPARSPAAITVAATTRDDGRSPFSNWGHCVDIFAPGSGIVSACCRGDDQLRSMSGTSMACPHVSGAAALLLSNDINLSPDEVRSRLMEMSSRSVVADCKGSPNRFLFVGPLSDAPLPDPTTTRGPTPTPAPAVCADDPAFRDAFLRGCDRWRGYDCSAWWAWYMPYRDSDRLAVRKSCPKACGLCH